MAIGPRIAGKQSRIQVLFWHENKCLHNAGQAQPTHWLNASSQPFVLYNVTSWHVLRAHMPHLSHSFLYLRQPNASRDQETFTNMVMKAQLELKSQF